ncbi:MAG TPA: TcmI family type II polyketide cyclase [Ktedonobacteraceae bacterium]|nr:TcmI family type II polyketide cyclase [Ktedonobacteraceae bacterium]
MGYIRNAVLIHAPLEDVFKLTNNVRTWPDLFTEYASSEVLEEKENYVTFRLTTHPDESGTQWSWISTRWTDIDRKSTHSERDPSTGPFQRMTIRWWYDSIDEASTVMTWEQEFTMKPGAPFTDEHATNHLNSQTRIQQRVIKERVEQRCGTSQQPEKLYRGIIVGRHTPGSEDKIVKAFERSDATELPHIIGVTSRHVWVQGDIYVHFVEGRSSLPTVLKEYAGHPLFQEVKAELDQYVSLIYPDLPPMARQIYEWRNGVEA